MTNFSAGTISSSLSQQMTMIDRSGHSALASQTSSRGGGFSRSSLGSNRHGLDYKTSFGNDIHQISLVKSLGGLSAGLPYPQEKPAAESPSSYDFTTAYSYGTMEREYERDTQRMYDRIRASREARQFKAVVDAVGEILDSESKQENDDDYVDNHDNDQVAYYGNRTAGDEDYADSGSESEGIFDMDF